MVFGPDTLNHLNIHIMQQERNVDACVCVWACVRVRVSVCVRVSLCVRVSGGVCEWMRER